ncbi:hypothetical protein SDC9_33401 [bioreactor metagenome]|uniref:Uncharacterized protein n=1 Tax=bioreactor metagenome TaxID=1076179 RepID=A0A644V863_9ZZZZ
MSAKGGQQAEEYAEPGIQAEVKKAAVAQQGQVLVREGGKGGKAAAEAHGQEQAQFIAYGSAPVGKAVNQPDQKTTGNIYPECAQRKGSDNGLLNALRQQVTGDAAQKAAGADKQENLQHRPLNDCGFNGQSAR